MTFSLASPSANRSADAVVLVGLDFGSTTTSLLAVEAGIASHCATGRMALQNARLLARPEPVFTPFRGASLDLVALRATIEAWLTAAGIAREEVFAGGAIVTGLAAARDNADALARLVVELLGEAVVATADDPRLEAWLAFMGGSAALSRAHPQTPILNLDIGGGTTNPALGLGGQVMATGSYFIGARHLEFEPGSYRLRGLSRYGAAILDHLHIGSRAGAVLTTDDVARVTGFFLDGLKALVAGEDRFFAGEPARLIVQAPYVATDAPAAVVTFSGGVGELVYALAEGARFETTAYGDLGVDLARAILDDPRLNQDVRRWVPEHKGRATVQGLTLSHTEISGTTLFLSGDDALPLRDLPVVAVLAAPADLSAFSDALSLAGRSRRGACVHLNWDTPHPVFADVRRTGLALGEALAAADLPDGAPLVLLTNANAGKAIGNYATGWRSIARQLIVIDEIPERSAQFVNLGRLKNGVVPVSFYGMV